MTAKNDSSDREIVTSRVFDAPRELVFEAWTNPKHVVNWWGPNGFTNTIYEMAVKPGGVWRFMMHGPDGVDYPNKVVFEEVVPPERLVYTHSDDRDTPTIQFHVTVSFVAEGGKTRLTMKSIFQTKAMRDQAVKDFGALEGARQTLERLAAHLPTMR